MNAVIAVKTDGRIERKEVTRKNILSVFGELILEGKIDPTAKEIAGRTGITTRTLFRHFSDMESLHRSFIEEADASATRVMDEPFPDGAEDDWQQLLEVLINRRVRVYESLLPIHISTIWSRYRAALPNSKLNQGIARRRTRLKQILPDELGDNPLLFEALDGVLSIEYWVSLRQDQKLTVPRSASVVRMVVEKLTDHE